MLKASMLVAAAAALVTFAGASGPANAGHGLRHHHHHLHHFHHLHRPRLGIYIGSVGLRRCGYEYAKWMRTGSRFWKREYYMCRNGW
jgi:hypothetical protein